MAENRKTDSRKQKRAETRQRLNGRTHQNTRQRKKTRMTHQNLEQRQPIGGLGIIDNRFELGDT